MVMDTRPVTVRLPTSVRLTTKLKVPLAVGVPETNPLDDSINPGGSVPDTSAKLYGC